MDDPISALDANVRKKIFKQVFQGTMASKTRILVTHAIDFLHLTDRIVVMKDGCVQAIGTYEELQTNPVLQEVIAINKKNLEASRNQVKQDNNIASAGTELLNNDGSFFKSEVSDVNKINRSENSMSIGIVGQSTDAAGARESGMITDQKKIVPIEEENLDKKATGAGEESSGEESDDNYEPDPSEADDRKEEAEDAVEKDIA